MDPMSQFEEDRKRKEDLERLELAETIVLDDYYLSSRDLVGKGREVHPSGKQRHIVQKLSEGFKFSQTSRRRSTGSVGELARDDDDQSAAYFDLNAKPRIFISSGAINKVEPDSILRKTSRRYMFLFNDVIILCSKKDSADQYDVQQVLWAQDLRLKHLAVYSTESAANAARGAAASPATSATAGLDPTVCQFGFELIISKTRKRAQTSVMFVCDDDASKLAWVADLESMLLAYHRETDLANQLGWFHEVIQGTFHSAAYLGDSQLLRRHIRALNQRAHSSGGAGIDAVDESGMTALHWAVIRDHEVCVRILLDRGADVDALQKGLNMPLLLAAVSTTNSETLCRLLIEQGADLTARNLKDHDVVFMAVLYGHASKGLPWLLQLLNARGLDLNAPDGAGATPLHLCAKKNLARPIRMLVDSGADVNGKHGTTQLTPLQMACAHSEPDVETIRSFLDKGAYPNWRDLQGRTAFDLVLHSQQQKQQQLQAGAAGMPSLSQSMLLMDAKASAFTAGGRAEEAGEDATDGDAFEDVSSDGASYDGEEPVSGLGAKARKSSGKKAFKGFSSSSKTRPLSTKSAAGTGAGAGSGAPPSPAQKWRAMESTIQQVGDWAVKALPALLEISKRGGRCRPQQDSPLSSLRPSFRAAVEEAQVVWRKNRMPGNFLEFVLVREHSGEDLRLHKANWTKDKNSVMCELCSETFSIRVRRHHCRSCGVLCCDDCSSKRLVLSAVNLSESDIAAISAGAAPAGAGGASSKDKDGDGGVNGLERVCDGCFNRLLHEASQPSPDHFRVKQLKRCALDVIQALEELVEALDDPDGESSSFQSSLTRTLDSVALTPSGAGNSGGAGADRESMAVAPAASPATAAPLKSAFSFKFGGGSGSKKSSTPAAPTPAPAPAARTPTASSVGIASPSRGSMAGRERRSSRGAGAGTAGMSNEALINALKFRESKLGRAEDIVAKFLEASEGYQKVSKKLVEQKLASNRLWGNAAEGMD